MGWTSNIYEPSNWGFPNRNFVIPYCKCVYFEITNPKLSYPPHFTKFRDIGKPHAFITVLKRLWLYTVFDFCILEGVNKRLLIFN